MQSLAAMAYVGDNNAEFEAEVAKVLAIAPKRGEVYSVAGELAARNYRFDEAVTLVRRALELNRRMRARCRISASTCCGPATRLRRGRLWKRPSRLDAFTSRRSICSGCWTGSTRS